MVRKHKSQHQKPISNVSKEKSGGFKDKRNLKRAEHVKKLQRDAAKHFKPVPKPGSSRSHADDGEVEEGRAMGCLGSTGGGAEEQMEIDTQASTQCDSGSSGNDFSGDDDSSGLSDEDVEDPLSATGEHVADVKETKMDDLEKQTITGLDFTDPMNWPLDGFSSTFKTHISVYNFAHAYQNLEDKDLRSFWTTYHVGEKPNKEQFERDWLIISVEAKGAFCLPCLIFPDANAMKTSWTDLKAGGFKVDVNCLRGVRRHENSKTHRNSVSNWRRFVMASDSLANKFSRQTQQSISEWRKILRGILDAIMFLANGNLAFQGHSHNIYDDDCGNFLNLIKLLAKYYPPLAIHLERLKKGSLSYLSPAIQNEFISLCATSVKKSILDTVRSRKYYAIMFDSTPDLSHKQRLSQILRSVHCSKNGCRVEENFIDFISTSAKSGEDVTAEICKKLEEDGLLLQDCRGQGYDNGANMAGCYKGVQARILSLQSKARFVPCAAHSLNLVGTNSADKVTPAKLMLGKVQNLYIFFSASDSRWRWLEKYVDTNLRTQSQTRWSSRSDAVSALWNNFPQIVNALYDMSETEDFHGDVMAAAESHASDIANFKFILGLSIWEKLLGQINFCNLQLQSKSLDISGAEKILKVLCQWLKQFKEEGFGECLKTAKERAVECELDEDTGFEKSRRGRSAALEKKRPIEIKIQQFKAEFFDALEDQVIAEMEKRFQEILQCVEDFSFLWGAGLELNLEEKQSCAKKLAVKYPDDLEEGGFFLELETLASTIQAFSDNQDLKNSSPIDVLNVLYKNGLESSFVNTETALRIFLTLPVSVASNERAFSKLKLIKNYSRSSTGQERLTSLAILSIERKLASELDFDQVIDNFVAVKHRKAKNI